MLTRHAQDLWSVPAPQTFLGWQLHTRTTLVRLGGGGLWVHSPITLSDELKAEVSALGEVRYVVAPTTFHHLYVQDWLDAWPTATLYGAPGLGKKRRDLAFAGELDGTVALPFADEIDAVHHLPCNKVLAETTFVHRASRTAISTDLMVNLDPPTDFWTRQYGWIAAVKWNEPTVSRPLRIAWKGRATVDELLGKDFDRITLAHGHVIETGGQQALEKAFGWLT